MYNWSVISGKSNRRGFSKVGNQVEINFWGKPSTQEKDHTLGHKATFPVKAWVFAIISQEARESNEMVACTLSILNQLDPVLFDYDAYHSFIFDTFSISSSVDIDYFTSALTVMMPLYDCLDTNEYIIDITIQDRLFLAELIIIQITHFNIILGID